MSQRTSHVGKTKTEYALLTVLVLAFLSVVFLATLVVVYNVSGTEWPMWLTHGFGVVGVVTLTASLSLLWIGRGEHQKR